MLAPLIAQITLSWKPETFSQTLMILVKGMFGIFLVICIIWVFVALLNRLTKNKDA